MSGRIIIFRNLMLTAMLRILLLFFQHLEKLLIPNCKKIPNSSLCKLLTSNPSLLSLDISNKLSPSIDQEVMKTLVHSCRCLTVLKLSDYRPEDPLSLLVLCGRVAATNSRPNSNSVHDEDISAERGRGLLNSDCKGNNTENMERLTNMLTPDDAASRCADAALLQRDGGSYARNEYVTTQDTNKDASTGMAEGAVPNGNWAKEEEEEEEDFPTREEADNRGAVRQEVVDHTSHDGSEAGDEQGEFDVYEDDSSVRPLAVEDRSAEFGCLELETLWLENVNLTDQVAAVLLQSLRHLRDLNLSDTDICNPWRLVDKPCALHLKHLVDLDVKSTALSRSALETIPDFHPGLQKLAVSSTTLPPPTYCHVARLKAMAELELIGGQFYPCEAADIFTNGIMPAVQGVGQHLHSLNLTCFAHVEFSKIVLSCPVIRHLDLSHTEIFLICPCSSVGRNCPNLTSLNLGYAHIEAKDTFGQFLTEENVIHQMVGECPVLEELHLCGLAVTDDGLRTMYPGGEYPLKTVKLSRCKKLTIAAVKHLWDRCPFLNTVDLTGCKGVSASDYQTFLENCRETRPFFKLEGTVKWK